MTSVLIISQLMKVIFTLAERLERVGTRPIRSETNRLTPIGYQKRVALQMHAGKRFGQSEKAVVLLLSRLVVSYVRKLC